LVEDRVTFEELLKDQAEMAEVRRKQCEQQQQRVEKHSGKPAVALELPGERFRCCHPCPILLSLSNLFSTPSHALSPSPSPHPISLSLPTLSPFLLLTLYPVHVVSCCFSLLFWRLLLSSTAIGWSAFVNSGGTHLLQSSAQKFQISQSSNLTVFSGFLT
jgi:hypothetical protein